jgi:hypothetical protein
MAQKIYTNLLKKDITAAQNLGKQAFAKGLPVIPAKDKELMTMIKGLDPDNALVLIRYWGASWRSENSRYLWKKERGLD